MLKKILIAIPIFIGIVFLLFMGIIIYFLITKPKADISDIPQSIEGFVYIEGSNDKPSSTQAPSKEYNWYDSIEEAGKDTSLIESRSMFDAYQASLSEEIIHFETDEQYMSVRVFKYDESVSEHDFVLFTLFYKQDGQYSQPYNIFSTWIDLNTDDMYTYDCDDAAIEFINLENTFRAAFDKGEEGTLYCGFWTDEKETNSMTFGGRKIDGIETINFFDTPYYFWYATLTDAKEKLRKIDYSDYTYQEIIDVLELKYEKREPEAEQQ